MGGGGEAVAGGEVGRRDLKSFSICWEGGSEGVARATTRSGKQLKKERRRKEMQGDLLSSARLADSPS
ncbi:hypothetical protein CRG98_020360 [Punica granatum]|uniref:Uncharacterized protein n=1 Tax=Punica granatum TaxID=22663 RepID=A0A2I0JTQ6_PUNGR|nr:hypothetical protein CRG98_020360 [Punica granatum]